MINCLYANVWPFSELSIDNIFVKFNTFEVWTHYTETISLLRTFFPPPKSRLRVFFWIQTKIQDIWQVKSSDVWAGIMGIYFSYSIIIHFELWKCWHRQTALILIFKCVLYNNGNTVHLYTNIRPKFTTAAIWLNKLGTTHNIKHIYETEICNSYNKWYVWKRVVAVRKKRNK